MIVSARMICRRTSILLIYLFTTININYIQRTAKRSFERMRDKNYHQFLFFETRINKNIQKSIREKCQLVTKHN